MTTTVACVWVRGNVDYPVVYVARLAAMVRRWLTREHTCVCFTDRAALVPAGVTPIEITPLPGAGWWSKLHLFRPNGLTGRVLYLDLDSLIVGDLAPFVDAPGPFAICPDDGSAFRPKYHDVIKRFNSSVMAFDAGVYPDLWHDWRPTVPARLWGDQDWIAESHPEAATFPAAWCPRLSAIGATGIVPPEARVILAKKPKPAEAASQWPWVADIWRP